MEGSYNGQDGIRLQDGPKLTLKGDNSFNGNSRGFKSVTGEAIVVKGGVLNAFNNSRYGVRMLSSSSTLTVKILLVTQKITPMDLNAAMNALTVLLLSNGLVAYLGLEFDSGERNVSIFI